MLESVISGRAETRERGEPVVPGGEELVAGQPGGRQNEAPQKAPTAMDLTSAPPL
jgi:hypothetical protein